MAFMRSEMFNDPNRDEWPLFMTVGDVKTKFPEKTKVMVAIGGWGNEDGFREAARSEKGRYVWAKAVKRMVESTGADGTYSISKAPSLDNDCLLYASILTGSTPGKSFENYPWRRLSSDNP